MENPRTTIKKPFKNNWRTEPLRNLEPLKTFGKTNERPWIKLWKANAQPLNTFQEQLNNLEKPLKNTNCRKNFGGTHFLINACRKVNPIDMKNRKDKFHQNPFRPTPQHTDGRASNTAGWGCPIIQIHVYKVASTYSTSQYLRLEYFLLMCAMWSGGYAACS